MHNEGIRRNIKSTRYQSEYTQNKVDMTTEHQMEGWKLKILTYQYIVVTEGGNVDLYSPKSSS